VSSMIHEPDLSESAQNIGKLEHLIWNTSKHQHMKFPQPITGTKRNSAMSS